MFCGVRAARAEESAAARRAGDETERGGYLFPGAPAVLGSGPQRPVSGRCGCSRRRQVCLPCRRGPWSHTEHPPTAGGETEAWLPTNFLKYTYFYRRKPGPGRHVARSASCTSPNGDRAHSRGVRPNPGSSRDLPGHRPAASRVSFLSQGVRPGRQRLGRFPVGPAACRHLVAGPPPWPRTRKAPAGREEEQGR